MFVNSINDMLSHWLVQALKTADFEISQIAGDASYRQYYRVILETGSYIVMIVPNTPAEMVRVERFITISELLSDKTILVPIVLCRSPDGQYLLLSDLGNTQYLKVLNENTADDLYRDALDVLFKLQKRIPQNLKYYEALSFPVMNHNFMQEQVNKLFWDWFVNQFLALLPLKSVRLQVCEAIDKVIQDVAQQPKVLTHFDFHSRNLMLVQKRNPGVLDFQDAMWGPVTYDLASLFHDCYISWSEYKIHAWLRRYYMRIVNTNNVLFDYQKPDYETFLQWFYYAALQRHLKNLGVFSRLHLRDHKTSYLHDIPTILDNILFICSKFPELHIIEQFFQETIIPVFKDVFSTCVIDQPCEP